VLKRFDRTDVVEAFDESEGDPWVQIDGTRYWISGEWSSQFWRLRHLRR
jgi:hypothetical protein